MVNKRTAQLAFKTEAEDEDLMARNGRNGKVKIESESEDAEEVEEGESETGDTVSEAMRQAWQDLNVPWKDRYPDEEDDPQGGDVLAIIGCGTLASAIFGGILRKYDDESFMDQFNYHSCGPTFPPYRFILNCSSSLSCERLNKDFVTPRRDHDIGSITAVQGRTVAVAQSAKYILLGCKPYMVAAILSQPGMRAALHGKILISICAGVTNEDLEKAVYGDYAPGDTRRCKFLRVMPNTAARINQSMTVIATPPKPLLDEEMSVIEFLFSCVGEVVELPADKMDAATALAGSGPAFYLLMLEGMIDGAVSMGIPRAQATKMAAQTMKGAAMGVQGGQFDERDSWAGTHPAVLRDQVTTPGGCTMGGLMVLEEEGVRGAIAKCVRRTTVVASQLGGGVKNVNGL